ncbi:hypothetical protein QBC33DRAFT_456867 [Phialemonium atrogriseum]|uniref:NADH-ubiquinone oxidoreductase 17.8 kDa subunit n=1 Tax=Phialemonium atrogriseum TaxID=1093897 RepID=A0AAJ0BVC7_9PEZI|nr:uncharacterized protein QBC33DRAFT_456867 [Phialemonium atrogriseum]KAK1764672.1 hypothetical protein QBC33DRAFT_456867 [Phialemonium atrogriseum]
MSAIRQGAACIARRSRSTTIRNARSYASDAHGHQAAPPVEESLGTAFYVAIGAVATSAIVYSISRPGKDGEPSTITKLFDRFAFLKEQDELRNTLRTAAIEQAAHDKHLLYYAPRNQHVELKYPEVFTGGSPFNVPAGHNVNLDNVVAHYRERHHAEEERKAKKLAAAKQLE